MCTCAPVIGLGDSLSDLVVLLEVLICNCQYINYLAVDGET